MTTYNYHKALTEDIITYLNDNSISYNNLTDDELNNLYDDLWLCDYVTGNASGSYYCNSYKAFEACITNLNIYCDACEEWGYTAVELGERIRNEEWEYIDVTIRCYLLSDVLYNLNTYMSLCDIKAA